MSVSNNKKVKLSRIAQEIPEFHVLKIDAIANGLIKKGKNIKKLNLGKSQLPMPRYVIDEFVRKIKNHTKREIISPQGLPELRAEIAKRHNKKSKIRITQEQVFINNGTSPMFLWLYILLANPGEGILLPRPYYPTYCANATAAQLKKDFYEIDNGRINLDSFKKNFKPGVTKIVILNSPGNPYGNVISKYELKEILKIVNGKAFIIADEIYEGFVYEGISYTSILELQKKKDKIILLNGFSKIYHLYTRRLGYAIVPLDIAEEFLRFHQHNLVCVDPVTQYAGLIALKNRDNLMRGEVHDEVNEYEKRMKKCIRLMKDTKLRVIPPEGSFYMSVDVSRYLTKEIPDSLTLAELVLKNADVAVTPGEDFGRSDFFRISLTGKEVISGFKKMVLYLNTL